MVPNAPERILRILEQNNETERKQRQAPHLETRRRDWMGFACVLSLIVASILFAWLSGGAILLIIGVVIFGFVKKPRNNTK